MSISLRSTPQAASLTADHQGRRLTCALAIPSSTFGVAVDRQPLQLVPQVGDVGRQNVWLVVGGLMHACSLLGARSKNGRAVGLNSGIAVDRPLEPPPFDRLGEPSRSAGNVVRLIQLDRLSYVLDIILLAHRGVHELVVLVERTAKYLGDDGPLLDA